MLTLQGDEAAEGLATVYGSTLEKLFREQLSDAIAESLIPAESVWTMIMQLAARGVVWAEDLIDNNWPTDRDIQLILLRRMATKEDSWSRREINKMLPPVTLQEMHFLPLYSSSIKDPLTTWASLIHELRGSKRMFAISQLPETN